MKAKVTQDETGIQWEIKDDGSAEYQKAAQLTREANERARGACPADGIASPLRCEVLTND